MLASRHIRKHGHVKNQPDFGEGAVRSVEEVEPGQKYRRHLCLPTENGYFVHRWDTVEVLEVTKKGVKVRWPATLATAKEIDFVTLGLMRSSAGWPHYNHLERIDK